MSVYLTLIILLRSYLGRIGSISASFLTRLSAVCFSRDRANFQLNNRRLERKVKELMLQVDDEHLSLTDQKDQVEGKTNMLLGIISDICINHHMYKIFQKNIGRY